MGDIELRDARLAKADYLCKLGAPPFRPRMSGRHGRAAPSSALCGVHGMFTLIINQGGRCSNHLAVCFGHQHKLHAQLTWLLRIWVV